MSSSVPHTGWQVHYEEGFRALQVGNYQEAQSHFQAALRQAELNSNQLGLMICLNELAAISIIQCRLDEAEILLRRALAIAEKVGPGSLELATTLNKLGSWHHYRGELPQAEHHFQQAVVLVERRLGHYHPKVAGFLDCLG